MSAGGGLHQADLEAAIDAAKVEGFTVVRSAPDKLLLDLDSPAAVVQFEKTLPIIQRWMEAVETGRWLSKGGNLHVVITLGEELPMANRLFLQAVLGSDGIREFLGFCRLQNGVEEPSLLFRPRSVV